MRRSCDHGWDISPFVGGKQASCNVAEEGQTIFWRWRVQVEVEGPVLLLLTPPFFLKEEGEPSTSAKTEVEGFSYTEYPLPPKFGGGGSSTTFTNPSVYFRGRRGRAWRQGDRGWRGYCILSATREEPHPPETLLEGLPPKKGVP